MQLFNVYDNQIIKQTNSIQKEILCNCLFIYFLTKFFYKM